jgi:hypothetical protein
MQLGDSMNMTWGCSWAIVWIWRVEAVGTEDEEKVRAGSREQWGAECSPNVHWMLTEFSLNVPWISPECSLNVPWMFPECSLNVPWIFPECSLNVPAVGREDEEEVRAGSRERWGACFVPLPWEPESRVARPLPGLVTGRAHHHALSRAPESSAAGDARHLAATYPTYDTWHAHYLALSHQSLALQVMLATWLPHTQHMTRGMSTTWPCRREGPSPHAFPHTRV